MNTEHLIDLSQAVLVMAAMLLSWYGYGSLLLKLLDAERRPATWLSSVLWAGWAATMILLQIVHLFTAIRATAALGLAAVGIVLALLQRAELVPQLRRLLLSVPRSLRLPAIGAALGVGYWLIARGMVAPGLADSGVYHFQTVAWLNEYAIVRGLGNLEPRHALNSSYFLLLALLNFEPYFNHGYAIGVPLLSALALFTALERGLSGLQSVQADDRQPALLQIALIPVIIAVIAQRGLYAGPSPDNATALVMLTISLLLVQIAWYIRQQRPIEIHDIGLIITLAAAVITMKVSSGAFAAAAVLLLPVAAWSQRQRLTPVFVRSTLLGLFSGLIFMGRGILLSGYPLFPLRIGGLAVEWAIPAAVAEQIQLVIAQHARYYGAHSRDGNATEPWFGYWYAHVDRYNREVLVALVLISVLISVLIIVLSIQLLRTRRGGAIVTLALLPSLGGLLFWLLTAPAPRFATGLLLSTPLLLVWAIVQQLPQRFAERRIIGLLVVLAMLPTLVCLVEQRYDLRQLSVDGFRPIPTAELTYAPTADGLMIAYPVDKRWCWDAPLPCTRQAVAPTFRLIDSETLQGGFSVLPAVLP